MEETFDTPSMAEEVQSDAEIPEENLEGSPYRTYHTKEAWQQDFDRILGKRLRTERETREENRRLREAIDGPQAEGQPPEADPGAAFCEAVSPEIDRLRKEDEELYGALTPQNVMEDPGLLRLLAAGIPLKEAYDAVHLEEIRTRLEKQLRTAVTQDIRARGARPAEGASQGASVRDVPFDVDRLSKEELKELKARAMRGERITF